MSNKLLPTSITYRTWLIIDYYGLNSSESLNPFHRYIVILFIIFFNIFPLILLIHFLSPIFSQLEFPFRLFSLEATLVDLRTVEIFTLRDGTFYLSPLFTLVALCPIYYCIVCIWFFLGWGFLCFLNLSHWLFADILMVFIFLLFRIFSFGLLKNQLLEVKKLLLVGNICAGC